MEDGAVSRPTDFNITFSDREHISQLEEYTTNMKIILLTMLDNVIQVRDQCKKYCLMNCEGKCEEEQHRDCSYFVDEFDGYVKEATMYIGRAGVLYEKVRSTAHLVSTGPWHILHALSLKLFCLVIQSTWLRRSQSTERSGSCISSRGQVSVDFNCKPFNFHQRWSHLTLNSLRVPEMLPQ
jgi:hypothetical protein